MQFNKAFPEIATCMSFVIFLLYTIFPKSLHLQIKAVGKCKEEPPLYIAAPIRLRGL